MKSPLQSILAALLLVLVSWTASASPAIVSSPASGSTLSGASQSFTWNDAGASLYQLWVGNSVGAYDVGYYPAAGTTATSTIATGLPTDGRTLYVRLWSKIAGVYEYTDTVYLAATSAGATPASITSPAGGSTLSGASQLFQWNDAGASLYQVWVGNSPGAYDVGYFPAAGTTATSTTVSGLPTDGRTLYVRLWSMIAGVYEYTDATFTAASGASPAAMITNPAGGSTLSGASQLFQWNDAGASLYQVWVGNSPGAYDIGYFPAAGTTATSTTVSGLPTDGRTLYVRLWSKIAGVYQYTDATFTAAPGASPAAATIMSPVNGSTLAGASQLFQWNNAGASLYQVWVGNSPGSFGYGYYPTDGTTATSTTVTGLPTDGRTLYVRLWSKIGGTWHYSDSTYTAQVLTPLIVAPSNGSTLPGATVNFQWRDSSASLYQLWVGNSVGAYDIGAFPVEGTTELNTWVSGLPVDGRKLYVRLWAKINGAYEYGDHVYTALNEADLPPGASLTSPADGSTLAGDSQLFQWTTAPGASFYVLYIGTTPGTYDVGSWIVPANYTAVIATGLPQDGRTLYATLRTRYGEWYSNTEAVYTAANTGQTAAVMVSPTPGSTFNASSVEFIWTLIPGATNHQVWIGNAPGGYDLGYYPEAGTPYNRTTVTGLPVDGRTLYVRLWSLVFGTWQFRDYTYTSTYELQTASLDRRPFNREIHSSDPIFSWYQVAASQGYRLEVGSSAGANDIYDASFDPLSTASWIETRVTGVVNDGRTIYARLSTLVNGTWYAKQYVLTTFADKPAQLANPRVWPLGSNGPLPGSSQVFSTTAGYVGLMVSQEIEDMELVAGTSPGGAEIGRFPWVKTYANEFYVRDIPTDGRTLHLTLRSRVGLTWYETQSSYATQSGPGAAIASPPNGEVYPSSRLYPSGYFIWNDVGADRYELWSGCSASRSDVGVVSTTATSASIATVYGSVCIRLWSFFGATGYYRDYYYSNDPG